MRTRGIRISRLNLDKLSPAEATWLVRLPAGTQSRMDRMVNHFLGWRAIGGDGTRYWAAGELGTVTNATACKELEKAGVDWKSYLRGRVSIPELKLGVAA